MSARGLHRVVPLLGAVWCHCLVPLCGLHRVVPLLPGGSQMLPDIAAAVAGRVPVLVDGGVRRGTDVIKVTRRGLASIPMWPIPREGV